MAGSPAETLPSVPRADSWRVPSDRPEANLLLSSILRSRTSGPVLALAPSTPAAARVGHVSLGGGGVHGGQRLWSG